MHRRRARAETMQAEIAANEARLARSQAELAAVAPPAATYVSLAFVAHAPGSLGITLKALGPVGVAIVGFTGDVELARAGLRADDRIENVGGENLLYAPFDAVVAAIQRHAAMRPLEIRVLRAIAPLPVATYTVMPSVKEQPAVIFRSAEPVTAHAP